MQDNFSIRDWKNTKLYKESYEGSLEEGMPSQEEVMDFLRSKGEETHYLMDKPVSTWDEYDLSNWKAKKKRLGEQDDFEADADEIEFEIPGDENAKPVIDKNLNKSLKSSNSGKISMLKCKEILKTLRKLVMKMLKIWRK
jgi:hypothetical protein